MKAGTISQAANTKRYRRRRARGRRPRAADHDARRGRLPRRRARPRAPTPTDLLAQARCSGRVPIVTAVLGSSAGHGALVAPMSDFTVMSQPRGRSSPPVRPWCYESMGETITKEDLGGPGVAIASGLIHNVADDDEAALDLVRTLPALLPVVGVVVPGVRRRWRRPSAASTFPSSSTSSPATAGGCYDMRKVIDVVFDAGSCFEVQPGFGRSDHLRPRAGSAAIRLRWWRTSRWRLAGSIDADGADKAAHFITVADSFHLPLVFLSDNPGVLARQRVRAAGDPAQGRADVRGADARDDAEVRGDAAQGVRLRLDGDGDDPVRRPVGVCSRSRARRWVRWARPR